VRIRAPAQRSLVRVMELEHRLLPRVGSDLACVLPPRGDVLGQVRGLPGRVSTVFAAARGLDTLDVQGITSASSSFASGPAFHFVSLPPRATQRLAASVSACPPRRVRGNVEGLAWRVPPSPLNLPVPTVAAGEHAPRSLVLGHGASSVRARIHPRRASKGNSFLVPTCTNGRAGRTRSSNDDRDKPRNAAAHRRQRTSALCSRHVPGAWAAITLRSS
jgi:hypothetical protein